MLEADETEDDLARAKGARPAYRNATDEQRASIETLVSEATTQAAGD